eukprot:scaffold7482_cov151-Isochrysis_galbana.AAC.2
MHRVVVEGPRTGTLGDLGDLKRRGRLARSLVMEGDPGRSVVSRPPPASARCFSSLIDAKRKGTKKAPL